MMISSSEPGATRPVPVTCVADRRFPVTVEGRAVQMPLFATGELVRALLGPDMLASHSLHIVPGVGHDHRAMFISPAGRALLFGDGRP